MQLVLSLFPGIDLFGRGFEAEGFSVVRGPDLIYGSDIRGFHVPAGRFDGVIGGSPCPDFSRARRAPPSGLGLELLAEFGRVVLEASPRWWLLENVPGVPDLVLPGYSHQRIDINARECGLSQNRQRHFQFGHADGFVITVDRLPAVGPAEPCCVASEGGAIARRSYDEFCRLQGLDGALELPSFTLSARYRAVGNAVPLPMASVMARAVASARPAASVCLCSCGCGREVFGLATYGGAGCRKRAERKRRRAVTDLV